jgi:quercetin dioxygenase-like cupin family protein
MSDLFLHAPKEGEALWFLDTLMQVKLSATATAGQLAILEQLAPAGSATPLHRHDNTDEYFYILAGEVVFYSDADVHSCVPGTFVAVPRGTPHAFRVSAQGPARLLVISSPARFEHFVRAVSVPATQIDLPKSATPSPADVQHLAAVGAQHDVVLLGPPPADT